MRAELRRQYASLRLCMCECVHFDLCTTYVVCRTLYTYIYNFIA